MLTNRRTKRPERVLKHATMAILAATMLSCPAFASGEANSYLQSARQLEKANDFRGAEIQLRNAAEAEPANGAIRLELAQIYLRLGNPNAAQAELFAAHMRGVKEADTAPLMGQALLATGEFGDLLRNVPAGNRQPKVESLVRTYRGLAQLALGEVADAQTTLADAERLDPKSLLPKIASARLLLEQRKFDDAGQKIDQALAISPKNSQALDAKGLLFLMRGQVDAAAAQFSAAIASDPRNVEALLDRANIAVNTGQLDRADADIKAVQAIQPGSGMALFLRAQLDARQGKFQDADAILNKLRGAMTSVPQAFLLAAQIKLKLNQTALAEDDLNKFVAQRPNDAKAWQILGMIALHRGDANAAVTKLERARNLDPKDVQTLSLLGQAYMSRGQTDKAKAVLDEAALEAPQNQNLQTERALSQFASGESQASLSELAAIFKGGSGNLVAGPPLALEALQAGRMDLAATAAEALTKHDPSNQFYQQLLALVRVGQHNFPAAEGILRAILAKQPGLGAARRNLAQIYVSTNRVAEAKKLYLDLLQKNQNDAASLEALADIDAGTHDYDDALKLLSRAQSATPQDPTPGIKMVALSEVQKKWPDAIARARALQQKYPADANVADTLGRAYFESGDHQASAATYDAAAVKFPRSAPILAHDAAVLTADKNYAKALDMAAKALALDPSNMVLKGSDIYLTFVVKGADAAVTQAESFVPQGTSSEPAAVLMTSQVLDQSGRRSDAIALVEKWQARQPSGTLAAALAGLYQRDQKPDKAVSLLVDWTKTHPGDVEVRFGLAQLYGLQGKSDLALAQYEWLEAQKPNDPVILNNLAWLYSVKHDPRAKALAQKAAQIAPTSGAIADTLGWILLGQGDRAEGMKYLQQASASAPDDATVQYHYAVALSQNGKADEARAVLEKVLAAKPSSDTLSAARTLLASLGQGH